MLFHLLFLNEFLQEGLRELWLPVPRQAEFPQHFLSAVVQLSGAKEDRYDGIFSASLCLKPYSAGGESHLGESVPACTG